jgi:hypothetical protein
MSKVKKITVSNLKAITDLTASFDGCSAIITGRNNAGKSSFLRSLPDRLRGDKPDIILKQGADKGHAEWELSTGEKFIWTFDGKKEKLTFVSERNIPQSVTKDLSRVYFPPIFDVDEFLSAAPAKQKATLQNLTGIDFTEIDRVYKEAYDERTWANKRFTEEKARFTLVDPTLPTEERPIDALVGELAGIDAHNQKYQYVAKGVKDKEAQEQDIDKQIAALQAQILELQKKAVALHDEQLKGEEWMAVPANALIPATRKKELEMQIEAVRQENKEIADNNKAKEHADLLAKVQLRANEADARVKAIEAEKLDVIKNASMPEGFGFDAEGITYNGFAFNRQSLSSSAIYIAALKLAAIGLGDVRMLHFDASFLDKNSLAEIEQWAETMELQLLIERVAFDAGEIHYELINQPS